MSALVTWLVAAMMAFAPPSGARKFPGWTETEAEARARYQAIAEAIEAAATHKAMLKTTTPADLADVVAFVRTLKK